MLVHQGWYQIMGQNAKPPCHPTVVYATAQLKKIMNFHETSWNFKKECPNYSWIFMKVHEHSWKCLMLNWHKLEYPCTWWIVDEQNYSWKMCHFNMKNFHEISWRFLRVTDSDWKSLNLSPGCIWLLQEDYVHLPCPQFDTKMPFM